MKREELVNKVDEYMTNPTIESGIHLMIHALLLIERQLSEIAYRLYSIHRDNSYGIDENGE